MPFFLKETDVLSKVDGLRSALIVPCRFCPAASLAVRAKTAYLEPWRRLLRTKAYESSIRDLKRSLESRGIKTAVFESRLLHQSMESSGCRLIQGMEIEGLMNVLPHVSFPLNLSLELNGVTPMRSEQQVSWENEARVENLPAKEADRRYKPALCVR